VAEKPSVAPKLRGTAPVSPTSTGSTAPAGLKAIVFDVGSGIKTTHLADGTVQEDLFDPAELASLKAARGSGKTRISVVNETPSAKP